MRVFILGGTGVISREIVKKLLQAGHQVVLYNRGSRALPFLQDVEQVIGDRSDKHQFRAQMKQVSCDVVIDMIAFTEEDAKMTIDAFGERVSQMMICSSVAAYKRPFQTIPTKEDAESLFDSDVFPYSYQKAQMERYIQRRIEREQLPITVIRPSLTYGIGGMNVGVLRQNFGIVDRIRKGKPLVMFGDGTNPWNFTFAEDLAAAFAGAVGNTKTYGQTYHATNDTIHCWDDLYIEFANAIGKEAHIVHLPTEILYEANPDLFAHLRFEKMYAGLFDNAKIKTDIPTFNPRISLSEGLQMLMAWYERERHTIDPQKDALEDQLVELHHTWLSQARNVRR